MTYTGEIHEDPWVRQTLLERAPVEFPRLWPRLSGGGREALLADWAAQLDTRCRLIAAIHPTIPWAACQFDVESAPRLTVCREQGSVGIVKWTLAEDRHNRLLIALGSRALLQDPNLAATVYRGCLRERLDPSAHTKVLTRTSTPYLITPDLEAFTTQDRVNDVAECILRYTLGKLSA